MLLLRLCDAVVVVVDVVAVVTVAVAVVVGKQLTALRAKAGDVDTFTTLLLLRNG